MVGWLMATNSCTLNDKPVDLTDSIPFSVDLVFTLFKTSLGIVFPLIIQFVNNDTVRGAAIDNR